MSKIRYYCFIVDSNGWLIFNHKLLQIWMNLCAKSIFHSGLITLNFFRKNILYSIFFWIGCIRMESIENAINGDMKMVIIIFTISFLIDHFFYFCFYFCLFLQSSILKLFNDSTYQWSDYFYRKSFTTEFLNSIKIPFLTFSVSFGLLLTNVLL